MAAGTIGGNAMKAFTWSTKDLERPPRGDVDWVRSIVERIQYKPTWRLVVSGSSSFGLVEVQASYEAEDVAAQGRQTVIGCVFLVNPLNDEERIVRQIVGEITKMEMHERDEWLRYRGIRLNEPHTEAEGPD